jgi:hypothetical protein
MVFYVLNFKIENIIKPSMLLLSYSIEFEGTPCVDMYPQSLIICHHLAELITPLIIAWSSIHQNPLRGPNALSMNILV